MIGKVLSLFVWLFLLIGCSSVPFTSGLLECDTDIYKEQVDVDLFNAAKVGDLFNINTALEEKADINACDRLGQSALMWASWNGHSAVVKRFVSYDDLQREKGKKNYTSLKYSAVSKEKYNALFCLIMSNSIQKKEAMECMELFLEREPKLLTMTDQYNENCLHKAIRSGNKEYLNFFLERLKKTKNSKLVEQVNTFSETPLVLAVKLRQAEMTKILIQEKADLDVKDSSGRSLSVLAFDNGQGDYNVYLEIMKEKLRVAVEEGSSRDDTELKQAIDLCTSANTIKSLGPFIKVYNKFSSGEINNPEELDDGVFKETEKKFFAIFDKTSFSQKDIGDIKEMLYETPALVNSAQYFPAIDMYKTPLQLSIESGNKDLFDAVFKSLKLSQIRRVGMGVGNYLVCAILNCQPEIIETLLAYEKSGKICPEELMATYHGLSPDLSEFDTSNPVVQFIMTDDLRADRGLLESVLSYYKPQFAENANYAGQIFGAALKCQDESLLLFIKDFQGFNNIDKVFNGRPLQYELIENNYFDTLKHFINNGNLKYNWKDTEGKILFRDILESRKTEPEVSEILDLFYSKGVFVDSPVISENPLPLLEK